TRACGRAVRTRPLATAYGESGRTSSRVAVDDRTASGATPARAPRGPPAGRDRLLGGRLGQPRSGTYSSSGSAADPTGAAGVAGTGRRRWADRATLATSPPPPSPSDSRV